jgi:hypothetical protein
VGAGCPVHRGSIRGRQWAGLRGRGNLDLVGKCSVHSGSRQGRHSAGLGVQVTGGAAGDVQIELAAQLAETGQDNRVNRRRTGGGGRGTMGKCGRPSEYTSGGRCRGVAAGPYPLDFVALHNWVMAWSGVGGAALPMGKFGFRSALYDHLET